MQNCTIRQSLARIQSWIGTEKVYATSDLDLFCGDSSSSEPTGNAIYPHELVVRPRHVRQSHPPCSHGFRWASLRSCTPGQAPGGQIHGGRRVSGLLTASARISCPTLRKGVTSITSLRRRLVSWLDGNLIHTRAVHALTRVNPNQSRLQVLFREI